MRKRSRRKNNSRYSKNFLEINIIESESLKEKITI